jgi:hypothetical protein
MIRGSPSLMALTENPKPLYSVEILLSYCFEKVIVHTYIIVHVVSSCNLEIFDGVMCA